VGLGETCERPAVRADIRPYQADDWPILAEFIRTHWAAQHPILDRAIFDWQYRGFVGGPGADTPALVLLWEGPRLLGFFGMIWGDYQINDPAPRVVRGCALAMWMIHPDYRQAGLGLLLLREIERRAPVVVCLGANAEAGGYYTRRGYRHCAALRRWVVPLAVEGYRGLCAAAADTAALRSWADEIGCAPPSTPVPVDPAALAAHWLAVTRGPEGWSVQGLHRTAEFWRVRYLESVGFRYLLWGRPGAGPVLVGRVEAVLDRSERVLRLIELIPGSARHWFGAPDADAAELVRGVLAWAAGEGCVAADFQVAGDVLDSTMAAVGMRAQGQPPGADSLTSLAPVFQPLHLTKPPINAYWKAPGDSLAGPWYFPKSDGDMDRPHARI